MKVNIEIDCTPAEARAFLGLPDLEPMQKAAMAEMEKRILEEAKRFSPEAVLQSWMAGVPGGADWLKNLSAAFTGQGQPPTTGKK